MEHAAPKRRITFLLVVTGRMTGTKAVAYSGGTEWQVAAATATEGFYEPKKSNRTGNNIKD